MFAFLYELSFVSHQIQTTHHHYLKGAQELWIEHGPLVWTYVRASSDVRLLTHLGHHSSAFDQELRIGQDPPVWTHACASYDVWLQMSRHGLQRSGCHGS